MRTRVGSRVHYTVASVAAAALAACQGAPATTPLPSNGVPPVATAEAQATAAGPSATAKPPLPTGRVVFARYAGNPEGPFQGFYELDAGQSNATRIELPITVDGGGLPAWSSDGTRLVLNVYLGDKGGQAATMKPDGTEFQLLDPTGLAGDLECTAWSPDAKRLLCDVGSDTSKVAGIYELPASGEKLTRLTTSPYHYTEGTEGGCGGGDSRAVYSPDGRQFAFIRQKCGSGPAPDKDEEAALIVGDVATHKLKVVVERGLRTHAGSQLSWSPDGAWIAYGTQGLELALVRPDGSDQHLVDVQGVASGLMGPTWSPDSSALLVCTLANGSLGSMYMVSPDGSGAMIIPGTYGGAFPRWAGT